MQRLWRPPRSQVGCSRRTGDLPGEPDPGRSRLQGMRAPSRSLLLLVVVSTLLVGACSAGGATPGPSEPPATGADPGNLAGRTFLSTAIDGRVLAPGSRVRLTFDVGRIGASAGCNSMSGSVAIVNGRLIVGDLATTEMACDPALMAQDSWLAAFLDGASIALAGDTLTLAKDGVTLTLLDREVADPDRPLLGTRWVVVGIVSGDAVSSVPAGIVAAITLADGRVAVETGCNSGGGPVTVADTTLTFGPLTLTEMACAGDARFVESAVTAVLSGDVRYAIEADTLTLDAGAGGLVLQPAP